MSLIEQLITIKRVPYEFMLDFKYRFLKTWDRISVLVRPSANCAFLYFLRALESDIAMMIQSLGGDNLPEAYDISIKVERCLIQDGKLDPRLSMPLFPEVPAKQPTLAPIPLTSIGQFTTPSAPPST